MPSNRLAEELLERFQISGNQLVVGGRLLSEYLEESGGAPAYIYDSRLIDARIAELKEMVGDNARLHYAIKANPMPELVAHIARRVDGLDVASVQECRVALATGFSPDEVSFAGPGKSVAELEECIRHGITINVESPNELERICQIAKLQNVEPSVAVRVNPEFDLRSSGMKMSGGPKQFGIDSEKLPDLLRYMKSLPVRFVGFHIFSGSQNLNADAICESQEKAVDLAINLARYAPEVPQKINIGGGIGIPYFAGDRSVDLEPIRRSLERQASKLQREVEGAELVIELGRFIVGEAGIYVCSVLDKKESRGEIFAVVNGGLHHHLAASGNFGQVLRKDYPILNGSKLRSEETEAVNIVGPLCTPLDILGKKARLPALEVGDLVVIMQSGAYGYTASPLQFLSHPAPREFFV